jgi:hypothetical protein
LVHFFRFRKTNLATLKGIIERKKNLPKKTLNLIAEERIGYFNSVSMKEITFSNLLVFTETAINVFIGSFSATFFAFPKILSTSRGLFYIFKKFTKFGKVGQIRQKTRVEHLTFRIMFVTPT